MSKSVIHINGQSKTKAFRLYSDGTHLATGGCFSCHLVVIRAHIKVKKVVTILGPVELEEPVPNLKAACSFIYPTNVREGCS